jgi:hypothetical protein
MSNLRIDRLCCALFIASEPPARGVFRVFIPEYIILISDHTPHDIEVIHLPLSRTQLFLVNKVSRAYETHLEPISPLRVNLKDGRLAPSIPDIIPYIFSDVSTEESRINAKCASQNFDHISRQVFHYKEVKTVFLRGAFDTICSLLELFRSDVVWGLRLESLDSRLSCCFVLK